MKRLNVDLAGESIVDVSAIRIRLFATGTSVGLVVRQIKQIAGDSWTDIFLRVSHGLHIVVRSISEACQYEAI